MVMANKGGQAHDVVHMSMGYEYSVYRLDHALGEMGDLAAVEEQRPFEWPDTQEQQGVIQKAAEEGCFKVAEWETPCGW